MCTKTGSERHIIAGKENKNGVIATALPARAGIFLKKGRHKMQGQEKTLSQPYQPPCPRKMLNTLVNECFKGHASCCMTVCTARSAVFLSLLFGIDAFWKMRSPDKVEQINVAISAG